MRIKICNKVAEIGSLSIYAGRYFIEVEGPDWNFCLGLYLKKYLSLYANLDGRFSL